MRFCPFCSAENTDESAVCATCGRRLPPLPPRRRNAPPTGIQLPNRPKPASNPPPVPAARAARPSQPPPVAQVAPNHDASALRNAISPGPAAQRRDVPPDTSRDPNHARRANDQSAVQPRSKPVTLPPSIPRITRPMPGTGFEDDFNTTQSAAYSESGATVVQPEPPNMTPPVPLPAPPPASSFAKPASSFKTPLPSTSPTFAAPAPAPLSRAPLPPPTTPEPLPTTYPVVSRASTGAEPPPTRIQRAEMVDRPFTPPQVDPVPEIPEPGLINAARYSIRFWKARYQRRGAIKTLGSDIKQDTEALDQVLGALGRAARGAKVDGRVFSAENQAITSAEERAFVLGQEHGDVDGRKAEENSKFLDVERERNQKLDEASRAVDESSKELAQLDGQRRGLRDKRKELERRQKAYLKGAEDAERQAGNAQLGDQRTDLRRSAEQFRKEAGLLDPERQEMDRKLSQLERPINEATARLDAAKAELDAAKRSLADAREGHTHRLAELDAEQKRKAREIGLAEGEISRRLVTLGTLVNLNRIEDVQFSELYQRIDRLRSAITARTTEIEKLTAEREAYDRGTLVRGIATIGGAVVAFIALIVILRAVL